MSSGSMETMEHLIKLYKKKIMTYESVETVMLVVENTQNWMKETLK